MGGKLGSDSLGQFKLGDSTLEGVIPGGGGELPMGGHATDGLPIRRSRRRRLESIFNTEEEEFSVILDSL